MVPQSLRELVLSYQNTCQVMTRLWFWAMAVLFLALPLGILGAGRSWVVTLKLCCRATWRDSAVSGRR
jgi:hypothetical protein